jgi:hypothetical protein
VPPGSSVGRWAGEGTRFSHDRRGARGRRGDHPRAVRRGAGVGEPSDPAWGAPYPLTPRRRSS